jgi:hypothetical protein
VSNCRCAVTAETGRKHGCEFDRLRARVAELEGWLADVGDALGAPLDSPETFGDVARVVREEALAASSPAPEARVCGIILEDTVDNARWCKKPAPCPDHPRFPGAPSACGEFVWRWDADLCSACGTDHKPRPSQEQEET